jgi:hypothetical protein
MKRIIFTLTLLIGSFTPHTHCSFLANIPTYLMKTTTTLWRNATTLGVGLPVIGSFVTGFQQEQHMDGVALLGSVLYHLHHSIILGIMTKAIDPSDRQGCILYCSTSLLISTAALLLGGQARERYQKVPHENSEEFNNLSNFQKKIIPVGHELVHNPAYAGKALMALAVCSALYYGSK